MYTHVNKLFNLLYLPKMFFTFQPMITWSDFLSLFSDDPTRSGISEMFEFLKSQDWETLPKELQDVLKWHENKLKSDVSFSY